MGRTYPVGGFILRWRPLPAGWERFLRAIRKVSEFVSYTVAKHDNNTKTESYEGNVQPLTWSTENRHANAVSFDSRDRRVFCCFLVFFLSSSKSRILVIPWHEAQIRREIEGEKKKIEENRPEKE